MGQWEIKGMVAQVLPYSMCQKFWKVSSNGGQMVDMAIENKWSKNTKRSAVHNTLFVVISWSWMRAGKQPQKDPCLGEFPYVLREHIWGRWVNSPW